MTGKVRKMILSISVCILAFFLVNGMAFMYRYDPEWLHRSGGMTRGVYTPQSRIIINNEGNGYGIIDDNGYANYHAVLDENYMLVFGNSQSNGHNVHYSKTYVYLLNRMLGALEKSYIYNVSNGGYTICDIVKGFKAGITEFPNSEGVIIQIGSTDFDLDTMTASLNQREYSDKDSVSNLMENRSFQDKVVGTVKNYFPFFTIIAGEKYPKLDKGIDNVFCSASRKEKDEEIYESKEYKEVLSQAFTTIRAEYDGKVIILYLPLISIENSGMVIEYDVSFEDFVDICLEFEFEVVDMGEKYLEHYKMDYSVPYGYSNTAPGRGHLNNKGHEMVAQALLDGVNEVRKK